MSEKLRPAFVSPLARCLLLAGVASYLCTSIHAPSFYEGLTIGHYIKAQGAVPFEYHWASAVEGKLWRDTSWLFHLSLSVLESVFGSDAFIILKMLLLAAFFCVLGAVCGKRAGSPAAGVLFALMSGCGIMITTTLGSHLLGWSLLVVSVEIGYRVEQWSQEFKPSKWELCGIFLFSAFFANVHASALLGFFAVAVLGRREASAGGWKFYCLGLSAFLLGQLCTPYGGGQLITSVELFIHFLVFELGYQLSPATIFQYQTAFLLLFWILLGLFLYQAQDRARLKRGEWLLLLGATVLALGSWQAMPYALLFLGVIVSALWGRAEPSAFGNLGQGIEALGVTFRKLPPLGTLWLLLCVLIVNVVNLWKVPFTKRLLPSQEMDFLLEQASQAELMHDRFSAPYLVYRFADPRGMPRERVRLTERIAFLNPEAAMAEERLERLAPGWLDYLDSVDAEAVLWRVGTPLYYALAADRNWEVILQYGKTTGESADEDLMKDAEHFGWAVLRREVAGPPLEPQTVE